MTVAALPYLLMAGGTVAQMAGQRQQQKERRNILNRSFEQTQQVSDKAAQSVVQEGAQYAPDDRMAAMHAQEDAAFQQARADIGSTGGATLQTASGGGNASADFVRAKAGKAIAEGNRITEIAREMARTRSPGDLMTAEGMRRADLSQKIGSSFGTARNMAGAAQMDAEGVDMPVYGKLGALAQMAGSAWAMGGAGAGAAPNALGYGAGYVLPGGAAAPAATAGYGSAGAGAFGRAANYFRR